jgi:hypothetical protein
MRKISSAIQRVALWALSGATVVCFWTLFAIVVGPVFNLGRSTIAAVTIPAGLIWRTGPHTWYAVMFLNAAIFGLVGVALEPLIWLGRSSPAEQRPVRSHP